MKQKNVDQNTIDARTRKERNDALKRLENAVKQLTNGK